MAFCHSPGSEGGMGQWCTFPAPRNETQTLEAATRRQVHRAPPATATLGSRDRPKATGDDSDGVTLC